MTRIHTQQTNNQTFSHCYFRSQKAGDRTAAKEYSQEIDIRGASCLVDIDLPVALVLIEGLPAMHVDFLEPRSGRGVKLVRQLFVQAWHPIKIGILHAELLQKTVDEDVHILLLQYDIMYTCNGH